MENPPHIKMLQPMDGVDQRRLIEFVISISHQNISSVSTFLSSFNIATDRSVCFLSILSFWSDQSYSKYKEILAIILQKVGTDRAISVLQVRDKKYFINFPFDRIWIWNLKTVFIRFFLIDSLTDIPASYPFCNSFFLIFVKYKIKENAYFHIQQLWTKI